LFCSYRVPALLLGDFQTGSCSSVIQIETHLEKSYSILDGMRSSHALIIGALFIHSPHLHEY
jgi:hypothetical protein